MVASFIGILKTEAMEAASASSTHHEGKDDGNRTDGLDGPQRGQAQDLDECEEVDTAQGHLTQVDVIWLVLGWHQYDHHPLHQLKPNAVKSYCYVI